MKFNKRHLRFNLFIIRSAAVVSLLMLMFSHASALAQSSVHVKIDSPAKVRGEEILLGDIAEITGPDSAGAARLKSIVVGRSPQPGETRYLELKSIGLRLKQHGMDLSEVQFHAAETIAVSRESNVVSKDFIKATVEDFLREKMPWNKKDVKIDSVKIPQEVVLPVGKMTLQIEPARRTRYLGTVPLAVSFNVDGRFEKKIWVNAEINVMTDVVVVKKGMGRYQRITANDLTVQKRNLADLPGDAIRKMEDAVGMRTSRSLYPKTVLRSDFIELPPIVSRGDIVSILYEKGALKVTARGITKEKGRKGERIRVANMDSDKVIYARVISPGTVMVDY